jgi:deoxypyrimidine-specific 5' nucleotidase type C protein (NT5C)
VTKRAIVDIDNTLWHFCDAFYEELRKINRNFPTPDSWTHWDLWEGYCSEADFYGAVNAVHFKQHTESYLPYPEAKHFLIALKENNYHITIASHRYPDYRKQTIKWLETHGLVYDELHLSFQKTLLFNESIDVVVDDSSEVLKKAVEKGVVATGLLFPWNSEYADNGFKLFRNLNDILRYVLKKELNTANNGK